jgi:hypothetical protein
MITRPMLYSAPMVRALLDGTKTQTRRVAKDADRLPPNLAGYSYNGHAFVSTEGIHLSVYPMRCPYGQPGDQLWVREAWKAHPTFDHLPPRDIPQTHVWYMADDGYKAESRYRQCKQGPLFKFFSFDRPHECRVHKPAQTEVIEQRSAWLHKPRGQASEA